MHTYRSSNGPDCSLIKKRGGGLLKPHARLHLLLNESNSFVFFSAPIDQLGDKCYFQPWPPLEKGGEERGEEERTGEGVGGGGVTDD